MHGQAKTPADGAGAYATHQYRDLFGELGHPPAETRAKIERAFQQLFHGDGQEERIYFETGANQNGPLAYITDWANNDARSEGMSYGMMVAVQLNKKREFDAIWNWSKTYMLVTDPANPSVGYFAWSFSTDATPRSISAAPDGEEYYAMALYFAAHRWGSGEGIYNYKAEADKILRGMRHHPVVKATGPFRVHPEDAPLADGFKLWPSPNNRRMVEEMKAQGRPWPPHFPMPKGPQTTEVGPMVDEEHAMIRFVPETNDHSTDASYHLPAFYELWSRWGPEEDRAFWARAAAASRDFFPKVAGPQTGLAPDRNAFDGAKIKGWGGQGMVEFSYDAWRVASNWSVDFSWWRKDQREIELSDRIQKFLLSEGIDKFADRYTTEGKPQSDRHSTGMVSTTAVASLAATKGDNSKAFVQKLWETPTPSGEQRYYDGLLYLMSLMHASGNFRIIE
jgi:oligosaccharide reducing-end xylanase